ncbi:MAG TPA: hypothetical protein VEH06_16170 [Candidatus Bathyarchaeia archaeon]|nr:hypothetical protein [Candidatus Bathyarchaeia archaeon]
MRKQTTFVTVAIQLTAIASAVLYNVKATNAQDNMSTASGANTTKGNMTVTGAVKKENMTSNIFTSTKTMNQTK